MNYKELEKDARLGNHMAAKRLEERRGMLEKLPIRDAMGPAGSAGKTSERY